jgi:uncharacterized protein (DUF58 family)
MLLWNDKRLRLSLTRLGLEYLATMILAGVFAMNSGNNLLYMVFSLMLGLFLVSGWVSRKAIRDLALHSIEEGNIFARVRGGIRVRLQDRTPRRIRALELHLKLERGRTEPGFYAGDQKTTRAGDDPVLVVLQVRPEKRGWCRALSLEIRTRYPFGFLEKAWRFPLQKELLVLPHPRSVAARKDLKGEVVRAVPAAGISSPEGARPYRIGDPPSRIHWKRTAQRSAPWVRTFEGEQPTGLRLHLNLRTWQPGAEFERELELLSGAILQARLQKLEVFLELTDTSGRHEFQGATSCWRILAQVQAGGIIPSVTGTDLALEGNQGMLRFS